MTRLECSAVTCRYNDNELCARGEIHVKGHEARTMCDTCCGSYEKEAYEGVSNAYSDSCSCHKDGKGSIKVGCEAQRCCFNESGRCAADHIGISGYDANHKDDTECASFRLD
ncbi:MAG: DUF1540 domain-containing protein [Clostridia bacterium]|nr:DUF1540 domain-containing protein [Clostridia bacterium]